MLKVTKIIENKPKYCNIVVYLITDYSCGIFVAQNRSKLHQKHFKSCSKPFQNFELHFVKILKICKNVMAKIAF